MLERKRLNPTARASPATQPTPVARKPCHKKRPMIWPRMAPSANHHAHLALTQPAQVTQGSVQPDARQRHCRQRKQAEQAGAQAAVGKDFIQVLLERHDRVNRPAGFEFVNPVPHRLGHLQRLRPGCGSCSWETDRAR